MQHSESLLTEILSLLQTLNSNVQNFEENLAGIESDFEDYKAHIDRIILRAFPGGLIDAHAEHHEKISRGRWAKRLIQWLDKRIG